MLFYILDVLFWQAVWLIGFSIYLLPYILLVLFLFLLRADADLSLLGYEYFGNAPGYLRGKVVWITGASSGIGENLAYQLARVQCKLVLSARRESELNRVKETCLEKYSYNKDIVVLPFDVNDTDSHKELAEKVVEKFGKIDILVNNAARGQLGWIKDTPFEVDRQVFDLLVGAQISLTKAVLPHFLKQKNGHVVVTSSIAGKIGLPFSAAYSMGKFALHGFFEAMRMEHATDNIDVTLICPGPVFSNIRQESFTTVPGETHGSNYPKSDKRMSAERCAQLMAVAIANKVGETWISQNPALLLTYLVQYMPDVTRFIGRVMGLKITQKIRQTNYESGQTK